MAEDDDRIMAVSSFFFSSPVIRGRIQEGESHTDDVRIDEIIPI
jgi:hypothetical protein